MLGDVKVFNMNVTADLTILEEANELIGRITSNKLDKPPLPMFTSCCPGWIKFMEHYYPEMLPNLSVRSAP